MMSVSNYIRTHREVSILLAVSFFAGIISSIVVYFAVMAHGLSAAGLTGDARGYLTLAEHLRTYHVFSFSNHAPFSPECFRSPGYPFFLALLIVLFGSPTAVLFAQALLLSIAPVLLYLLFRPYHERAAFWGALVFAVEPIRLFYSAQLLSDAFFVSLLLFSLVALERAWMRNSFSAAVLSGAVLGFAVLVRPIGMFLPLLYGAYLLYAARFSRRAWLQAGLSLLAALAIIGPWMLRNHELFHSWNISSVGTANLALYNAPEFLKFHPDAHGQAVLDAFNKEQDALPRVQALSLERSPVFMSVFLGVIRGHEVLYAVFHIFKTAPFFITDGLRDIVRLFHVDLGALPNLSTAILKGQFGLLGQYLRTGGLAAALFVVGSGFWTAVTVLWTWGVYAAARGRNFRLLFLLGILVLYFALLTGPVSNARYRLPVEGMLLVGAAAAVLHITERKRT